MTTQQIDDPGQWRAGDMFEGTYFGDAMGGTLRIEDGFQPGVLLVGFTIVRKASGELPTYITGHVTRTAEPIPEPTEPWALVRFEKGPVLRLGAATCRWVDVDGESYTWAGTQRIYGAPVAVSLPHWSDEVDGLRAEAREAVEDFIAHMEALDRGRITGREVAEHLRRALLAEGGAA